LLTGGGSPLAVPGVDDGPVSIASPVRVLSAVEELFSDGAGAMGSAGAATLPSSRLPQAFRCWLWSCP